MRIVLDTNVLVAGMLNPAGKPGSIVNAILDELRCTDLSIIVEPALDERGFGALEGLEKRAAATEHGRAEVERRRSSFPSAPET